MGCPLGLNVVQGGNGGPRHVGGIDVKGETLDRVGLSGTFQNVSGDRAQFGVFDGPAFAVFVAEPAHGQNHVTGGGALVQSRGPARGLTRHVFRREFDVRELVGVLVVWPRQVIGSERVHRAPTDKIQRAGECDAGQICCRAKPRGHIHMGTGKVDAAKFVYVHVNHAVGMALFYKSGEGRTAVAVGVKHRWLVALIDQGRRDLRASKAGRTQGRYGDAFACAGRHRMGAG